MTVTFEPDTAVVGRPVRRRVRPSSLVHHLAATPAPRPEVGHPLLAVSATLAAGSVAHAVQAAPWWFLAGGGVASVVSTLVTRSRFHDGGPEAVYAATGSAAVGGWLAGLAPPPRGRRCPSACWGWAPWGVTEIRVKGTTG